jgi:membrane fusion protein (multidrug efflux system)
MNILSGAVAAVTSSTSLVRRSSFAVLALAACTKPAPQAPPPSEVTVVTVTPHTVDQSYEYSGNVTAYRSVEVRPQVVGVIKERVFTEGSMVQAGQVLYRIDPTTPDAVYRGAVARAEEADARLANARADLERFKPLLADNAISKQDYDRAETAVKSAEAQAIDAKSAVDAANKTLRDAVVRAEISGRVGRAQLEAGARVRGTDDVLTTIDVLDPVYVTFQPSIQQLLSWRKDPKAAAKIVPGGAVSFEAVLPDGSVAPTTGKLDFVDPVIDPATGTQQFRAKFSNKQSLLLPGQFVRLRLKGLQKENAITIPQRAVMTAMGRQSVFVVIAGDSVRARDVVTTAMTNGEALVESGLAAGDRVIVDGIQKTGPGAVVKPVAMADSAAAPTAVPGATGPAKPAAAPAKGGKS